MRVYGVQWEYVDSDDSQYDCAGTMDDLFDNKTDAKRLLQQETERDYNRWLSDSKNVGIDPPTMETDKKTGITRIEYGSIYKYWVKEFWFNKKGK